MAGRRAAAAGAVLLWCTAAGAGPAPTPSVDQLGWLSGIWQAQAQGVWTEERWSPPRAGVMLGTSLSGKGATPQGYEFMRIAADAAGVISFWGSPGGQPPVPFRLVSASAGQAVFENPAHDYPTRIVYRRQGNVLTATVSGRAGSPAQSWRFRRR